MTQKTVSIDSSETDEYDKEVFSEMEDTDGLTVTGGMEQENVLNDLNRCYYGYS